jgi:hypothetical protein
MSKKSTAEKGCVDKRCPPSTYDDIDAANTFATMSNIGFIIAGVGAGVAVTGLIMGSPSPKTPSHGAWIHPYLSLGNAGIRGGF